MTIWVLIGILIKILVIVGVTQGTVAYLILVERKVAAYAQDRIGPNRCGSQFGLPAALLQPLADGAKMLLKEDVVPKYVTKPLYILAPWIAIVTAMIGFAVVPFGPVGPGQIIDFQIAPNVDMGLLYVLAVGSLAVYGVILAGWASNNKYAFIGGMRSSAQLISYEIPLGMSILGMLLIAGSLDMNQIIAWQSNNVWGVFVQPLGFILFFTSAFAETNRLPFDLPESEQELVGGFHTEYSAMKFGMFFLGEYLHIITISFITVIMFWGGWHLPFLGLTPESNSLLSTVLKVGIITGKVFLVILFIMWIRWTLPRFRYDQLMDLAWKSMIPLALINLVATAGVVQLVRTYWN
ncbi:NADH-quinone oxidoreductase subunit NuoH [Planctomyces sp. SH-PL62]|uniref:NADH-quinone oxidoreductase subunit NuoH n=1 Tax=Planctomyces sp. SH-PL62 TaxID=1636152 RepID=UPI00078D69FC|nr:NADH-quinone oxidoreductase subunit NuoH [Planctomyces sp. SH-PL62]AMV39572.1 NADH-quinone oxidoreductase subunit 8 [Planctomyces sp. SH-PL62]